MNHRRIITATAVGLTAVGLTAGVLAGTASASEPPHRHVTISSTVHLAGDLHTSTTVGTFALAGAGTDAGAEAGSGHFLGAGATPTGPNILEATQVFTGTDGTITVALEGRFGPLPARTAAGAGRWHIVSGTGSYTHEHGGGNWNAVADFSSAQAHVGPPTVTFLLTGGMH